MTGSSLDILRLGVLIETRVGAFQRCVYYFRMFYVVMIPL